MTALVRLLALGVTLALSGAALTSCSVDETKNPGPRCDSEEACLSGLVCHRGFCIAGEGAECTMEEEELDCYTGPAGTERIGNCSNGTRVCRSGVYTACLGQVVPTTEGADGVGRLCNGQDDDCDGSIDEFESGDCGTGEQGVCTAGRLVCSGETTICERVTAPAGESCNGEDADCDGSVDEDSDIECWPGGSGCEALADGKFDCTGVCSAGMQVCSGGSLNDCSGAVTPAPGDDVCTTSGTAVDDDCDGMTDEDCACGLGATQACYGGPMDTEGMGECRMGLQTCEEISPGVNRFGACVGEVVPVAEACDNEGQDDDCDGTIDEVATRGDPCADSMQMGVCVDGTLDCVGMGAALTCVTIPPAMMEACDGVDDDCDGTVDNGYDLLMDESNCGACGNVCGAGLSCCGGTCVDPQTDPTHCGTCGGDCGVGRNCCSASCADLQVAELNCGACGTTCGMFQQCCDSACTDPRVDEMNCGACGNTCAGGRECCLGACHDPGDAECAVCLDDCGAMGLECCDAVCVDTANDTTNCGMCGNACDPGQLCCGGACVPSDVSNCGGCGNTCAGSDLCCGGGCVSSDAANCGGCGIACIGGEQCCSNSCLDTSADGANCGACGNVCGGGEACSSGLCCPSGLSNCFGTCRDLQTSHRNCGRCGFQCRGNETCVAGCCERGGVRRCF